MQCREAQRRIDRGQPAAADPALAAHLTQCAACRAYRDARDLHLLADLLTDLPTATPAPASVRAKRQVPLRMVLLGIGVLLLIWFGITVGRVAYAAYIIQQNIAAMQVQPTPALVVPPSTPNTLAAVPSSALPLAPNRNPEIAAPLATLTPAPAISPASTAIIAADPRDLPPTAVRPAYNPSATPIQLPDVDGSAIIAERNNTYAPLPTLMPVAQIPVNAATGDQRAVNVLILGSDRRPGEGWASRSDAIIIARLDPQRQRVALLSLPRDLIVPIPGYGQARVNAATVYGELYPQLDGGTELARRTISSYLGIPIDHVVRVDFNAFVAGVDAIGGVEIDVERELYDPLYPTMNYGYQEVYFAPGLTQMDGERALIYSRVRHMDSNYARNRRQQQVLVAMLRQIRTKDLVTQIELIANLTTALRNDIQTDLSLEQMANLAWAMRTITPEMVERYAIDERMISEGRLADDPYATFANPAAVAEVARLLMQGR
jgi:LCP family protein required for cell wall assembly